MSTRNEELKVNISLSDRLSAGLGKVGGHLEQLNQKATEFQTQLRGNFDDLVAGAGAAIAAGAGVYAAVAPGVELERQLKTLQGLGLDGELDTLRQSAQAFNREFGLASSEFVGHARTVKRAIGEVNESELAGITAATAKLSMSTESDVQAVSKYLGRLYHTYQDEAERIGKVDFVSNLANMNAVAARTFGVTADEMAGAMESISSLAKNYRISLPEQIAVVGALQAEFTESDAASFYEAFIREGSKLSELGINTLDAKGQMRPILDILDQVKARFGELDATEFELLDEKAGDAAMVIQTLLRQGNTFRKALGEMQAPGTQALDALAASHTDTLKQLSGSWSSLQGSLSQAVLPTVNRVASGFIWLLDGVSNLAEQYPTLTTVVLVGVTGFTALTATISAGGAALAMMRTGAAALSPVLALLNGTLGKLTLSTQAFSLSTLISTTRTKALAAAQWALNLPFKSMLFTFGNLAGAQLWLTSTYTALTTAIQGMTVASLRQAAATKIVAAGQAMLNLLMAVNPVGLLIAALAIGAIMVIRYWEPIKSFFTGFVEGLRSSGVFEAFEPMAQLFGWMWDKVKAIGSVIYEWVKPIQYANDELQGFAGTGKEVGAMVGNFLAAIGRTLSSLFTSVIELLNHIPGIDIELPKPALPEAPPLVSTAVTELTQRTEGENNPAPWSGLLAKSMPQPMPQPVAPTITPLLAPPVNAPLSQAKPIVSAPMPPLLQHTAPSQAAAPTQVAIEASLSTMQPINQIITPPQPSSPPLAALYPSPTQGPQTSHSVQTGDIHIHRPLPEFSLLGLDEERILTIG
ncbi:phage tail tape measure protein [Shewanella algae]|uniref:phage tail tape measure protein n=1 Tax=Shewanella algae TaxID=38313 RepID=UPI003005BCBE